MSPDTNHDKLMPDAEAQRLQDAVRRLVLMKETGPKSAAWHCARVRTIWRLQRALEQRIASADGALGRGDPEAEDNRA